MEPTVTTCTPTRPTPTAARRGNTLVLVTAILVLLVIIATAFLVRSQSGRAQAAAQQKAVGRDDRTETVVQQVAQHGKGLAERLAVGQAREPAGGAGLASGPWRRFDGCKYICFIRALLITPGHESLLLQPVEITANGGGIAVAGPVQTGEHRCRLLGQSTRGQGREQQVQLGIRLMSRRCQCGVLTKQAHCV